MYKNEVINGSQLIDNKPALPDEPSISFCSINDEKWGMTEEQANGGVLAIGGKGAGKTNYVYTHLDKILSNIGEQDTMIIFDTKGDFARRYYNYNDPKHEIICNSCEFAKYAKKWNIFQEALADGSDIQRIALNINELARALFAEHESAHQPFFPNAARSLFGAYLMCQIRWGRGEKLTNKGIVKFFNKANGLDGYEEIWKRDEDLRYVASYLGDLKTSSQGLGVISTVHNMINALFVGVFGENGSFSIRNFVREKGGKVLFLQYDLSIGETLCPIYSLLVDLALKEVLSSSSNNHGNVYFILDELKLLPTLTHLDDAVNFGREMGVRVIAGLQSVNQLYAQYGEYKAKAALAGFNTLLGFRPNDAETRNFIKERCGANLLKQPYRSYKDETETQIRDGYVVEDWHLLNLKRGEAIVCLDEGNPFTFHFKEVKKVRL